MERDLLLTFMVLIIEEDKENPFHIIAVLLLTSRKALSMRFKSHREGLS